MANPPYKAGTLKPPLTTIQKTRIITYLKTQYSLVDITHYVEDNAGFVAVASTGPLSTAQFDTALIEMYNAAASGGGVNVSDDTSNTTLGQEIWSKYLNPWTASEPGGWLYNENKAVGKSVKNAPGVKQLSSVTDFLSLLDQGPLWIRVGEFAAGAILITVGFSKSFPTATRAIKAIK